jgi:cytochrome c-type biogenesis protein CcmE
MKPRHKKLIAVSGGVTLLVVAGLLVLNAFRSNLVYFRSPTEILSGEVSTQGVLRLGGMVDKGSVKKIPDSLKVEFKVTDVQKCITVRYEGILPDLFREGQGVITQGRLQPDKVFVADQVLAKHDEKYMPPEVANSLKGKAGPKSACETSL